MAVAASLRTSHESTVSKRGNAHFVAGKKAAVVESVPSNQVIHQERALPREAAVAVVASSSSQAHTGSVAASSSAAAPHSSSSSSTFAAEPAYTPSTSLGRITFTKSSTSMPSASVHLAQAVGAAAQNDDASVVTPLPSSTKSLVGAIVFLGLAIIGFAAFKLYRRQQRKKKALQPIYDHQSNASEENLDIFGYSVEKPNKSYNPFPPVPATPAGVKWTPQVASHITMPEASKRSKKAKRAWEKNLGKLMSDNCSPAQPYDLRAAFISKPVMPPSPPDHFWQAPGTVPMPPTPIKNNKTPTEKTLPEFTVVPTTMTKEASPATPRTPVSVPPTPRSASFAADISGSMSRQSNTGLPRAMKVTTLFEPTQSDELAISIGETVELLEEFADEWCLVRRAGERGVIPRFCISEIRV